MELSQIIKRAKEIRAKYEHLEVTKYGKSWTPTQIAQGFVGDVGDLMKIVMAKDGIRKIEDVDEALSHELADCLWSILILSDKYNVDIEKAFNKTMDELDTKIDKQLTNKDK